MIKGNEKRQPDHPVKSMVVDRRSPLADALCQRPFSL